MKTITNIKSTYSIESGKITMTADVVDKPYGFPVQQVTIGNMVATNPRIPRHVQISPEALFVKRFGADNVAFDLNELVDVALAVDRKLGDAPVIQIQPTPESLKVAVITETEPRYQWQVSDDGKSWSDVPAANFDSFTGESGKFYQCVIVNSSGRTVSNMTKAK